VPAVTWWIAEGGQSQGPFTPEQLASSGRLTPDTLVWTAGMPGWQAAAGVAALAAWLRPPPHR
jgi:hypothetical protein